jgi:hypothetical protein
MGLKQLLAAAALAAVATAAWGHPGHGATGSYHHFVDLLALGGIAAVFALVLWGRDRGDQDHD